MWGRPVALKILSDGAQQEARDSFEDEIMCMARLTPEGLLRGTAGHECLHRWQRLPARARVSESAWWVHHDPAHVVASRAANCQYLAMDMGGPELRKWLYSGVRKMFPFPAVPWAPACAYDGLRVPLLANGRTPFHAWLSHVVLPIMRQVLGCLAVAHSRGVAHLDLDPRNVIMRSEPPSPWDADGGPLVSLIDWGHLMSQDSFGVPAYVDFRKVKMKPPYGAPEVYKVLSREHVPPQGDGRAADLWSVGVLVSMMVRAFVLFSTTSPGGFQPDDDVPGTARYSRTYCKE